MTPEEIKQIRHSLGLTQPKFAELIGYSLRMVRYYESGEKEIPVIVEKFLRLYMEGRND